MSKFNFFSLLVITFLSFNVNGQNSRFLLQTGTVLHETHDNFNFLSGDYNQDGKQDIYVIKKSQTGTNSTEVHVLDGASNFSRYLTQVGTVLSETKDNFDFVLGDYNQDGKPDLYAIKKSDTDSNSTEVHVLDGASNFSRYLIQVGTVLPETKDNFDFVLGDYNQDGKPDLYAIKKSDTDSNSTEVHVLNGASNFSHYLIQTGTVWHESKDNVDFVLGDYNKDGKLDLYAIKKSQTGTNSTEVHVLNGASNFSRYLIQTGTVWHESKDNVDFVLRDYSNDGKLDLYAIKKSQTGTNSTEIHIFTY